MGEQQFNSEDGERQPIVYAELMNPAMVEEQPFYHKGMTRNLRISTRIRRLS